MAASPARVFVHSTLIVNKTMGNIEHFMKACLQKHS
jgi:hypothetical protein